MIWRGIENMKYNYSESLIFIFCNSKDEVKILDLLSSSDLINSSGLFFKSRISFNLKDSFFISSLIILVFCEYVRFWF